MISATDMIVPADDRRHTPGPGSLPLWNESYWFPIYDPKNRVGVVTRIGILPNRNEANLWLFITHAGRVVHNATDLHCPVPDGDIEDLILKDVSYQCREPLRRWRLLYRGEGYAVDLLWDAICPVYQYPVPPGTTADQAPRHLEQSGKATGTVTIAGRRYELNCLAHRDHSWGGERDWSKMPTWSYVSCEISEKLSFNAVKISFSPDSHFKVGFCWDGEHVMGLTDLEVDLRTDALKKTQTGLSMWLVTEKGKRYEVEAGVLAVCPVTIGRTQVKDAISEFRSGGLTGYGIIEYGYQREG